MKPEWEINLVLKCLGLFTNLYLLLDSNIAGDNAIDVNNFQSVHHILTSLLLGYSICKFLFHNFFFPKPRENLC